MRRTCFGLTRRIPPTGAYQGPSADHATRLQETLRWWRSSTPMPLSNSRIFVLVRLARQLLGELRRPHPHRRRRPLIVRVEALPRASPRVRPTHNLSTLLVLPSVAHVVSMLLLVRVLLPRSTGARAAHGDGAVLVIAVPPVSHAPDGANWRSARRPQPYSRRLLTLCHPKPLLRLSSQMAPQSSHALVSPCSHKPLMQASRHQL
mmetsp:Transcript_10348/g.17355  ORF Transcript_10348/g.17355 Transcript_10348/m.17355 type:complete len:205 (-) Transcript_10348:499-1113(-)